MSSNNPLTEKTVRAKFKEHLAEKTGSVSSPEEFLEFFFNNDECLDWVIYNEEEEDREWDEGDDADLEKYMKLVIKYIKKFTNDKLQEYSWQID